MNTLMQLALDRDQSIQALRRGIRLEPRGSTPASDAQLFSGGTTTEFSLEIRSVDGSIAEKAAHTLLSGIVEGNLRLAERDHAAGGYPTRIVVLRPPILGSAQITHWRLMPVWGAVAGLLLGLVIVARLHHGNGVGTAT